MKRECQINGKVSAIGVRSEEDGEVSITIGTTGRVVDGSKLISAMQKARTTTLKPVPGLNVRCTVDEVGERPDVLSVENSQDDSKAVILVMGDVSDEVNVAEMIEAVGMCSRKIQKL